MLKKIIFKFDVSSSDDIIIKFVQITKNKFEINKQEILMIITAIIAELIILIAVIYLINWLTKLIRTKQKEVESLSISMPESLHKIRRELMVINSKIENRTTYKPFSSQELGYIAGDIFAEVFQSQLPMFSFKKKFLAVNILMKLWKHRDRIKATLAYGVK